MQQPADSNTRPFFGAFILETLTLGMYGESRNAIREYVQNSFDGVRQAIDDKLLSADEVRVEITLDATGEELCIRDNGAGLRKTAAVSTLTSIGASPKDYRRNAGFRGIGRLAGIVFCNTLIFRTKAKVDSVVTEVRFDASKLREMLTPENAHKQDAATTLQDCITASTAPATQLDEHFFEVRLVGFHNPPSECLDIDTLKTFVSQVSPLPYHPGFTYGAEIEEKAEVAGLSIETIRLFAKTPGIEFQELYKPYRNEYLVKRTKAPLIGIEPVRSPTNKWWGWVGVKKVSGAIKGSAASGIRVRVRNIQIDGTDVMRDIFATSYRKNTSSRMSYARFVDWYVGEIFIKPTAVVPNARRDGFEENDGWHSVRDELDELVAEKFGKLAYRTSTADQLSVDVLKVRVANLESEAARLEQSKIHDWDRISPISSEAVEIQRRVTKATKATATDAESKELLALSKRVGDAKHRLSVMVSAKQEQDGCQPEIAVAISEFTQMLFKAFREQLPPSEWARVREILQDVSGEVPE